MTMELEWTLWLIASGLGALLIGCSVLEAYELIEALWRSPTISRTKVAPPIEWPFVSIHVPICSEPPEVVARTLRSLDTLSYENFEVVVVDNNTDHECLWKPVEELCSALGDHFRFFHLARWPGFKAGALNFALRHCDQRATLIAVVDCDYEVGDTFLADHVGYFDDPQVAFVQTPQNYRGCESSAFACACHWEYWQFFAVGMQIRDRRNAILLHGTMGLVRKEALEKVGKWAEWCVTEDSELGLRLLAQGFTSIYIPTTYGRGLLPFSFSAYWRQRRRWVRGGVQILQKHWRMLLLGQRPGGRLTTSQRLYYLQGWLPWLRDGLLISAMAVCVFLGAGALLGYTDVHLVNPIGSGLLAVLTHFCLRQVIIYRSVLSRTWRETLGAMAAILALTWAIGTAWLAGWLPGRPLFRRTPKKRGPADASWIANACQECLLGCLTLAMAVAMLVKFDAAGILPAATFLGFSALTLPAVLMAYLSRLQQAATGSHETDRLGSELA